MSGKNPYENESDDPKKKPSSSSEPPSDRQDPNAPSSEDDDFDDSLFPAWMHRRADTDELTAEDLQQFDADSNQEKPASEPEDEEPATENDGNVPSLADDAESPIYEHRPEDSGSLSDEEQSLLGLKEEEEENETSETPTAAKGVIMPDPEEDTAETGLAASEAADPGKKRRFKLPPIKLKHILWGTVALSLGAIAGIGVGLFMLWRGTQYQDLKVLENHRPAQFTRVYDRNGVLLDIISSEKRIILEFNDIPEDFVHALVAVEDEYFFEHFGVSPLGILGALKEYVMTGRLRGASTLTQQLVKNITDDDRDSVYRKFKEQLLALQVEQRFTKQEIFAMYANEVSLGNNQFGIEAAAQFYFGKSVGSLNLVECATLAGLPQAPSWFNPLRHPDRCKKRRNLVIERMAVEGYITREEADAAKKEPIEVVDRRRERPRRVASHFVDKVRAYLFETYGEEIVRTSRWDVYTTLDVNYQRAAESAVRDGLKEVDKVLGYRVYDCPSVFKGETEGDDDPLESYFDPSWHLHLQDGIEVRGLVTEIAEDHLKVRVADSIFTVDLDDMSWIKPKKGQLDKFFKIGDVPLFRVEAREIENGDNSENTEPDAQGEDQDKPPVEEPKAVTEISLLLEQEPDIEGAFMAVDPSSGDILAMVGGYDYNRSKFNRAEQAKRQVGSAFKPIVFGAALEQGYTLADILFDEPTLFIDPTQFYRDEETGELEVRASERTLRRMKLGLVPTPKPYQPHNYYNRYTGRITLRNALAQSKNIVSVKLLNAVGYDHVLDYAYRLSLGHNQLQPFPSLALGAMEMSLSDMVYSYAVFAEAGIQHDPRFITLVLDDKGRVVEDRAVKGRQVISPQNAYLVADAMKSVVNDSHGTAKRARVLKLPVAGKTGTTDDYTDAWFIGFTPQIAAGAWVGRDLKHPIGRTRTGGNTALPIWIKFMEGIRDELSDEDFTLPEGLVKVPVDKYTGTRITEDCDCSLNDVILEVFRRGNEPTEVCTQADKNRFQLPWYLQKKDYEYDPRSGRIKPDEEWIDYASQKRALKFLESKEVTQVN